MPRSLEQPSPPLIAPPPDKRRLRERRFFQRGLAALLPTLITLWLLIWLWRTLWENLGYYIIWGIIWLWIFLSDTKRGILPFKPPQEIHLYLNPADDQHSTLPHALIQIIGVSLGILLVYIVGLFVGNLIGRTIWRLAELAVMRIPLVRAIYPAVKQVTDFLLAERSGQFHSSRVVACKPHSSGIWSVGLVTGQGLKPLTEAVGKDMVTVFIPSSPTAFSGYVVVVPRESVVELPLTVEEALRLLVSGGVLTPADVGAAAPNARGGAVVATPVPSTPALGAPARAEAASSPG